MHTSLLRWVFTIDVLFFLFNTQTEQDIMSCCKMLYTVQHQTNATLNAPHTDTMSAETTSYEINNILTRTCCRLEGCQSVILMRSVPFKCSCLFFTVKSWKPQLKKKILTQWNAKYNLKIVLIWRPIALAGYANFLHLLWLLKLGASFL